MPRIWILNYIMYIEDWRKFVTAVRTLDWNWLIIEATKNGVSNATTFTEWWSPRLPPPIRFQGWRKEDPGVFFSWICPSRWLRVRILILLLRDSNGGWWRCQLAERTRGRASWIYRAWAGGCSHSRRRTCILCTKFLAVFSLFPLPPLCPFSPFPLSSVHFYLSILLYPFSFFSPFSVFFCLFLFSLLHLVPSSRSNLVS